MSFRRQLLIVLSCLFLFACKKQCTTGDCSCENGESCDFVCENPPCNAVCEGNNPECHAGCGNGSCKCGNQSNCDFECVSSPCHVECVSGSNCQGTCANGDCECAPGANCDFSCDNGPCHVLCGGDNESCNGQCSNGTCRCAPGSQCSFECLDHNCNVLCESGNCLLKCAEGERGTQGCRFDNCTAGSGVTLCDDGLTLACGAACPVPETETPAP